MLTVSVWLVSSIWQGFVCAALQSLFISSASKTTYNRIDAQADTSVQLSVSQIVKRFAT